MLLRSKREITRLFDNHIPEEFQLMSLRLLFSAYKASYLLAREEFQSPEFSQVWGVWRRALIEKTWRELAAKYKTLRPSVEQSPEGNHQFTQITAGPVVLTQSRAGEMLDYVPRASFRDSLTLSSQLSLPFDDNEEREEQDGDAKLYVMLIHRPDRDPEGRMLPRPKFADFVFPARDQNRYAARIELFTRFEGDVFPDLEEESVGEFVDPSFNTDFDVREEGA